MNAADRTRWERIWRGISATDQAETGYDRLVALYAEPQRHYHTLDHIAECLIEFDAAPKLASASDADATAVELAIWFHDSVYNPRATDNEEKSAELASEWLLNAGAPVELRTAVSRLVLATKTHDPTMYPAAPFLVDVDLSILGKPAARFFAYEEQIRQEYAWVPAFFFSRKRAQILKDFLKRQRIYSTPWFYDRYENQARINLQASLER